MPPTLHPTSFTTLFQGLLVALVFASNVACAEETRPPATVAYVSTQLGKPPLRFVKVRLQLHNRNAVPTWFLFRTHGEKPLTDTTTFKAQTVFPQPFELTRYMHRGKSVVVMRFYAAKSRGFHALYLQPGATVTLKGFRLDAWSTFDTFEIWETSDIQANATVPLEAWLPYRVLSDDGAMIPNLQDDSRLLKTPVRRKVEGSAQDKLIDLTIAKPRKWFLPLHIPKP